MLKSRHCFVAIIHSRIKMSTHSYTAIICTRSRGSFCCTLLACQRIKKKHWMISQSIIREARLFAHTSVLMQVNGEETRRKACLLWHITFSPSPSIACWDTESWCLYAAGRGWGVRCAGSTALPFGCVLQISAPPISQPNNTVYVRNCMNSFSLSAHLCH